MPAAEPISLRQIPTHVAIIMDGNGRWAKARGLPRLAGHKAGTENLRRVIKACAEFGIKYLTVYAFSTENWKRPQDEVAGLMRIMGEALEREVPELNRQGARIVHVGSEENMPEDLRAGVRRAVDLTRNNSTITVCVAWNYGGRAEIVHALRKLIAAGTPAEQVDESLISRSLFTAGIPDPDLVIRTSGELRTSNFLLWQSAYAEWYFTPLYWPDFGREALLEALRDYEKRDRRFGKREDTGDAYAG